MFAIAWKLALLLCAVFWLSLAFWVYRDARHRIADPLLVATAALLGLAVPFVGPLVYLLFRPPEALADVRVRDAELRLLEASLAARTDRCLVCRADIQPDFLVCPVCSTRLRQSCGKCDAPLEPVWQVCPWCTTPAGAVVVEVDLDAALTAEAISLLDARKTPPAA